VEYLDADDLAEASPGGPPSVRDWRLLEAAAARPQAGYGGVEVFPTVFDNAAALLHAICTSHPFVDGNKRAAWVASNVFLMLNGYLLEADDDDAVDFVVTAAAGRLSVAEIAIWMEARGSS
jgi:death-on-curing protein